jgi:hypothetical protein
MLIDLTDGRAERRTVTSYTFMLFIFAKHFFLTVQKQLTLCSGDEQMLDKLCFI